MDSVLFNNISPSTHIEGDTITINFTLTRVGPATNQASVDVSLQGTSSDPLSASDFSGGQIPSTTIVLPAGESTVQGSLTFQTVNNDGLEGDQTEPFERALLVLDNGVNIVPNNPSGGVNLIEIRDSDVDVTAPNMTINVDEDGSYQFDFSGAGENADTIAISINSDPSNGSISNGPTEPQSYFDVQDYQTIIYTPDADFNGATVSPTKSRAQAPEDMKPILRPALSRSMWCP